MTLPELAERAGVSKGLVSQLENAESPNPSLDTLNKLGKALGVSLAVLLDRETIHAKQAIPDKMDEGLRKFLEERKRKKLAIDPHVAQALYVLQEREGGPKTADDWEWLYRSIEMSLNQSR